MIFLSVDWYVTSLTPVEIIKLPWNKGLKSGAVIVHWEPEKLHLNVNIKQCINFTAMDQCL